MIWKNKGGAEFGEYYSSNSSTTTKSDDSVDSKSLV